MSPPAGPCPPLLVLPRASHLARRRDNALDATATSEAGEGRERSERENTAAASDDDEEGSGEERMLIDDASALSLASLSLSFLLLPFGRRSRGRCRPLLLRERFVFAATVAAAAAKENRREKRGASADDDADVADPLFPLSRARFLFSLSLSRKLNDRSSPSSTSAVPSRTLTTTSRSSSAAEEEAAGEEERRRRTAAAADRSSWT